MPTSTSIGATSANSGQTIGPAFSVSTMQMLTNTSQDNQGMLGSSNNNNIFTQANGPDQN